jgi:hypothetical protein
MRSPITAHTQSDPVPTTAQAIVASRFARRSTGGPPWGRTMVDLPGLEPSGPSGARTEWTFRGSNRVDLPGLEPSGPSGARTEWTIRGRIRTAFSQFRGHL